MKGTREPKAGMDVLLQHRKQLQNTQPATKGGTIALFCFFFGRPSLSLVPKGTSFQNPLVKKLYMLLVWESEAEIKSSVDLEP